MRRKFWKMIWPLTENPSEHTGGCVECSRLIILALLVSSVVAPVRQAFAADSPSRTNYLFYVTNCLDTLIESGTDRYGPKTAPILVSILDVETRQCPSNPAALDEQWRVTRRERRNPAGANLLSDQPTLKTLYAVSQVTGQRQYAWFADHYIGWYLANLADEKGLLWWGWHRHYDVFRDEKLGHLGNPHEIHAIHCIAWDKLWAVNPAAVRREIEAIWQWHVIDKQTGEVNRHGDGQRGCDFAMSAGACLYAFAFLYTRTHEPVWLDRAKLLARYYRDRRHPDTGLFPDRPNAGSARFDGSHFVTADTGLYCHALLKSYELTGESLFRDDALAYLRAYRRYGYDTKTGQFWGSLNLDGTPVAGSRVVPETIRAEDYYQVYEPRGHLDLWQPYVAGYEHALATAQVYAYAAQLTGDAAMLDTAKLFARLIETNLPPRACLTNSWYRGYAEQYAPKGTHAGSYGQTISFFIHMHLLTGEARCLVLARRTADEAIARLYHQGLFRGHPAKPYYEAVDGVGYLLYALLEMDLTLRQPQAALANKALSISRDGGKPLALDNW